MQYVFGQQDHRYRRLGAFYIRNHDSADAAPLRWRRGFFSEKTGPFDKKSQSRS
uniref:Uncharacterized protein n=1 Tax=uncultured marine microorganism HF4000_APKG2J17 TaxID=455546 RepID=B3T6J4_9ZZZZ|nr:hypothetical protein ALOHA_HF4000APKG2J17ctg1g10 [uncultured marine microorganism HF4000_APKG2J17]